MNKEIERSHIATYIGEAARNALLEEVNTTPKPGLVDQKNAGAHKDMDIHTFLVSAKAIAPYFTKMAQVGYMFHGNLKDLFQIIRKIGMDAEKAMFLTTNGVNTHKGLIFSLGILCAISGWYYCKFQRFCSEEILLLCPSMTYSSLEHDFEHINQVHPKTHGEQLFVSFGIKGIRGEVQEGFPSIRNISLPVLRKLFQNKTNKNLAFLETLLYLMAEVDDTNVIIRTNWETLEFMKLEAKNLLNHGGALLDHDFAALNRLNDIFTKRNISPGGCADLLAVTIFMWSLEQFSPI